jgi:alkaline phosphatase D
MNHKGLATLMPKSTSRRMLLQAAMGVAGSLMLPRPLYAGAAIDHGLPLFRLGVASGYPSAGGCVVWTRLAPIPLSPDGGMPASAIPVNWVVAADEALRDVRASGISYATPDWAHSVHVEVSGLEPDRPYWYRFTAMGQQSPVGRTHTAPAADSKRDSLKVAVASCQNYEHGYYAAYRHMVADAPDLIVHVGDYIYEGGNGADPVRRHDASEAQTLEDYRIRHSLYRLDPDLQAAHAAAPWLCTWDDHEVDNDYTGDISEQDDDPALFRLRRAAAMKAYYEHLPVPRSAVPFGSAMRLYQQRNFGPLASFYMLDGRQFRSPHACSAPGIRGSRRVENCAEVTDESRTMLGFRQEAWLAQRLQSADARWNLFAQGVMMSYLDELAGPGEQFYTDSWNGYAAARRRLLAAVAQPQVRNPLILSGDIHAFFAGRLNAVPGREDTPVVASELVTTSITSRQPGVGMIKSLVDINSNVLYGSAQYRGYLRLSIGTDLLRGDMVGLDDATNPRSGARVVRSFVMPAGQPLTEA